jgi:hypothetical protein
MVRIAPLLEADIPCDPFAVCSLSVAEGHFFLHRIGLASGGLTLGLFQIPQPQLGDSQGIGFEAFPNQLFRINLPFTLNLAK